MAKYSSNGISYGQKILAHAFKSSESSIDFKFDDNNKLVISGFFKDQLIIGNNALINDTLLGNALYLKFYSRF